MENYKYTRICRIQERKHTEEVFVESQKVYINLMQLVFLELSFVESHSESILK